MYDERIGTAVFTWGRPAVALVALVAVAVTASGQERRTAGRFSGAVSVDVVTVDVVVSDRRGRPVAGLERSDFRVFEDGVEMELSNFGAVFEEAPGHAAAHTRATPAGGETAVASRRVPGPTKT